MNRSAACALAIAALMIGTTTASGPPPEEKPLLAVTPPMGWSSWNRFGCAVDEREVRENADAMVASGMSALGYRYINVDDCWMAPARDAGGRLQADPQRFPSGIRALADYVHAKGLKLGIYSSAGTKTCAGLPASLGHERVDAATFAQWGVDLLKYDNCGNDGQHTIQRFTAMGKALHASGRDIVYAVSEWGDSRPWEWAADAGAHYWRTYGDIADNWDSMLGILDKQAPLWPFSRRNRWNDPDMLEVGNGGMTAQEYRAHISLWALLNAPLIAGNDLRSLDATTRELLMNREVIAVDQDWTVRQGVRVADAGDVEVWAKPMNTGAVAVVLLNRGAAGTCAATTATQVGLPQANEYQVRDLWAHTSAATSETVAADVAGHSAKMFLVSPG